MTEMRAAQLKEDLLALQVLGNDVASRILADLPPSLLRRIVHATRVDWLPVETYLELLSAIQPHAGDDGLRRWARAAVGRSIATSFFKPLVETAIRLFGVSPASIFKVAPQAWQQAFRGGGDLVVLGLGPGTCRVGLRDLPPHLGNRNFLVSIEGALEAPLDVCKVEGQVRLAPPSADLSAVFEGTWPQT